MAGEMVRDELLCRLGQVRDLDGFVVCCECRRLECDQTDQQEC